MNFRKLTASIGVFAGVLAAYLGGVYLATTDANDTSPWVAGIFIGLVLLAWAGMVGLLLFGLYKWWGWVQK